jgi:hypothetical protein
MLEVGDVFMKAPSFQAVVNSREFFIFSLNFGDDGASVCLKL